AAKMLSQLPQNKALTDTTGTVARNWLQTDSVAASQWINTLPPGDARDTAVEQIVNTQARNDPAATMNWATTIGNPDTRYSSIQRVTTQWAATDPQAAMQAVQNVANLTDEQRQKLTQAVQKIIDNPPPAPNVRIYRGNNNIYYGP
ncbi:MAG TPA: hypothetical protein VHC95_02490, partial [Opitutales bacterium]|nr:hypothetical protein [Opitutales bacterium]